MALHPAQLNRLKTIGIRSLKVIGLLVLLFFIGYFGLRAKVMDWGLSKAKIKIYEKYRIVLTVEEAGFEGFSSIHVKGVSLVPDQMDTLFKVNELNLTFSFWNACLGDLKLNSFALTDGYLQLIKQGDIRNFESLLHPFGDQKTEKEKESPKEKNYAAKFYKMISRFLNKIPNNLVLKNFGIKGVDDARYFTFLFTDTQLLNQKLNAQIAVSSNSVQQNWQLMGDVNLSEKTANILFEGANQEIIQIPYLFERFGLKAGFKSVKLELDEVKMSGKELKVNGQAAVSQLMVNHPKIASQDVVVKNAAFDFDYLIGPQFISLDSSSRIQLNDFVIHPFIKFENATDTVFSLSVVTEETPAQNFINALPEGLFTHIRGMKASGDFSYRLDFVYNENKPQEMIFESNLSKKGLKIEQFGEANLNKMNGEFVHYPYENGRPTRPIVVGMSNANFTPLAFISPFLAKCVLTTEDPSFFYHRGFVTEAFRQSIVKNIRTGKFKRGASTISMQLVKNVFLTREKTMARKLEEILLVYILENNYIVPKDRMLEVYFNIIEWGPNIYGIGEAAQFYFKKHPSQLTLSECLYLATIIPRPKGFMWRFNSDGTAKAYLEKSYHYLANKMLYRQWILPTDTIGLTHLVNLWGPARTLVIKSDTIVNDTLLEQELQFIHQSDEE
jgi:hypothetical protein